MKKWLKLKSLLSPEKISMVNLSEASAWVAATSQRLAERVAAISTTKAAEVTEVATMAGSSLQADSGANTARAFGTFGTPVLVTTYDEYSTAIANLESDIAIAADFSFDDTIAIADSVATSGNHTLSAGTATKMYSVTGGTVSLSGLTLDGAGSAQIMTVGAGATVTLDSVTVSNALMTGNGGAIHADSFWTLTGESSFRGNTATVNGGAVYLRAGGLISGSGSGIVFANNLAKGTGNTSFGGGAIYNTGNLTIEGNVLFDSNRTRPDAKEITGTGTLGVQLTRWDGNGGAIYSTGTLKVDGTGSSIVFQNNVASGGFVVNGGGAIFFNGSSLTVTGNVAFTGNHAISPDDSRLSFSVRTYGGSGGAIFVNNGSATIDAKAGDTISFVDNVSHGIDGGGAIFLVTGKSVTIKGEGDVLFKNNLVYDKSMEYQGNGGAIFGNINSGIVIQNSNTKFIGNESSNFGGAISTNGNLSITGGSDSSRVLFQDNVVANGSSRSGGGAIMNQQGNITLEFCDFVNNKVSKKSASGGAYGGAVFAWSNYFSTKNTISNSRFDGNAAQYGGAVFVGGRDDQLRGIAEVTLTDCLLENNRAISILYDNGNYTEGTQVAHGGAVALGAGDAKDSGNSGALAGKLTLKGDNTFEKNSAYSNGGAIYVGHGGKYNNVATSGTLTFSDSSHTVFRGNSAANGGAVYLTSGGTLNWSTDATYEFTDNQASKDGGAIYLEATDAAVAATQKEIAGITFTNNSASEKGGAIYNANEITVKNVVFSGNSASEGGALYNTGNAALIDVTLAEISDTVYNSGSLTLQGTIILNAALTTNTLVDATTAGTGIELALSKRDGVRGEVLINDYTLINGAPDYSVSISSTQTGRYALIGNAVTFDRAVGFSVDGVTQTELFTLSGSTSNAIRVGDVRYQLLLDSDDVLYLEARAKEPSKVHVTISTDLVDIWDHEYSLREAVVEYAADCVDGNGLATVTFDPNLNGQSIVLTDGALVAQTDTQISGNGRGNTLISGDAIYGDGHALALDNLSWNGDIVGGALDRWLAGDVELDLDSVTKTGGSVIGGSVITDGLYGINGNVTLNVNDSAIGASALMTLVAGGKVSSSIGMLQISGDVNLGITGSTSAMVVYAAGDVSNGGIMRIQGDVNIAVDTTESIYALFAGGRVVAGNLVTLGSVNVTIDGGTFTSMLGGGAQVQKAGSVTQGGSTITINGGTFKNAVFAGHYSVGGGTMMTAGTNLVINGGTFAAHVLAGGYASSLANSGNNIIIGDTSISIDASTSEIHFGGNIYGGGFGYAVINGNTSITITGEGKNLKFGNASVILGDSQQSTLSYKFITGDKLLTFEDFTGEVNAALSLFDTVTFRGDTTVTLTKGTMLDGTKLADTSTWNFELNATNKNAGVFYWADGFNDFTEDKMTLAFDAGLLGGGDSALVLKTDNANGILNGWTSLGSVTFDLGGSLQLAAQWDDDLNGWLGASGSDQWLLSAESDGLRLGKLA